MWFNCRVNTIDMPNRLIKIPIVSGLFHVDYIIKFVYILYTYSAILKYSLCAVCSNTNGSGSIFCPYRAIIEGLFSETIDIGKQALRL